MKRTSFGLLGCSLVAAMLALAASVGAARATTLVLSDTPVPVGGSFTITVDDPSFDPIFPTAILGVDISISFDAALLSFNSNAATVGSWLPNALLTASTFGDPGSSLPPGSALVSICCDFSGGTGSSLFSASFVVNGAATPQITSPQITSISFETPPGDIETNLLPGGPFNYVIDDNSPSHSPSLSAGVQITPLASPVPLPGTAVLFLTGIAILALFGRRAARYADTRLNFMFTSAQADGNA